MGERISIPPRCRRGLIPQSLILSHCVPPVSIPPRSQRGVRLIDLNNNVRINTDFQFHPVFHGGGVYNLRRLASPTAQNISTPF